MKERYAWKDSSHIARGIDAQRVGEELNALGPKLTADAVVDVARSPRSAMHPCFEWDDAIAAHEYRLEQARHLVRHILVVVERPDAEPRVTRAWICVQHPEDKENSYTRYADVMGDSELREQALARVKAQLVAIRRRHAELEELADVFSAIDRLGASTAA